MTARPLASGLAPARTALPRPELLQCVHCGLCLSACPTYRELKLEPDSPRGRLYLIRAMEEGRLAAGPDTVRHLDLCLNCRACETACPAGVRYGDLFERTRARLVESGRAAWRTRATGAVLRALFDPWERIEAAADALRLAQQLGLLRWAAEGPGARLLPRGLRLAAQLLPRVPARAERALPAGTHAAYEPHRARPRARVGLVATCVVQPLYPQVNRALLHLLRLAGCEVVVPERQACCGSLFVHAGLREEARRQARATLRVFPADLDFVVTASAGCGATLKEYAGLFTPEAAGAGERARAAAFAARARDALELLAELGLPPATRSVSERIAVHDPCHLAHAQGVRAAPRALLRALPGAEVVDLADSDHCCGSAGVYNLQQPGMAEPLLARKLAAVRAAAPTVVAVANPGCLLQMAAGARRAGLAARFAHPLEILAAAYPEPAAGPAWRGRA
jgi:glycolate oxidase iron-sulfur subunit